MLYMRKIFIVASISVIFYSVFLIFAVNYPVCKDIQILIKELSSQDKSTRAEAAQALGELGDRRAVEPLINILKNDNESFVRYKAVHALKILKDPTAFDQLSKSLHKDKDLSVRMGAALALGHLGDIRALEGLKKTYLSDKMVSSSAIKAIGMLNDERAIEELIKALKENKDDRVRASVAQALGNTKSSKAVEPLIETLKSGTWGKVRQSAAKALGEIPDMKTIKPLITAMNQDRSWEVQRSAMLALSKKDNGDTAEALISALKSKKGEKRIVAAYCILQIKSQKAIGYHDRAAQILANDSYLTSNTRYDKYDRPVETTLKDFIGNYIVTRHFKPREDNETLIKKEIIRDQYFGEIIHETPYDSYGKPMIPLWLCLDISGRIIKKEGKPILINHFNAKQKSIYKPTLNAKMKVFKSIKMKEYKIYPCENCAAKTGLEECKYVW